MSDPLPAYFAKRLSELEKALAANNFEVYRAEDAASAAAVVLKDILPKTGAGTVAFGGSMTLAATGLPEALKAVPGVSVIDTFDRTLSREALYERRRQALLADLFLTGTNAVTEDGILVNLDMIGNRACAIPFGPRHVVVCIGRNKIVPDLSGAIRRIKDYAAPANAARLGKKTPCAVTTHCEDCASPDRICNVWTITEKSYPKGRVKVVLINQDLGL